MQFFSRCKKISIANTAFIIFAVYIASFPGLNNYISGQELLARENVNSADALSEIRKKEKAQQEWERRIESEKKSVLLFTRRITGSAAVPSSVVALVHGKNVILKGAYRTRIDRMFPAASHTKFFTTLAIMQLEDSGLINIDYPISKYIPVKIARKELGSIPVTIRHILSHTSGLAPGRGSVRVQLGSPIPPIYIPRQVFPTGHRFHYSNQGFNLLGVLIATITGENLGDYITDNIITPLEMPGAIAPRNTTGASGVRWSLNDMVIFLKLFLGKGTLNGKRIVAARWFKDIYRQNRVGIHPGKHKSFRGLCWRVWTVGNMPYSANHASLWPGSGGWMQVYPTLNVAYVFMSDTPFYWEKSPEFKTYYFLMQRRLNRLAGMLSTADISPSYFSVRRGRADMLAGLSGEYFDPKSKRNISIKTGYPYLYVHNAENNRSLLSPVSENRFISAGQRYHFIRHEGRVLGIINNDRYFIRQYQNDRHSERSTDNIGK